MEIDIRSSKDNPLFGRKDVAFVVLHDGEPTPSRVQVRQLVAGELGTKTENVVIAYMGSNTGRGATEGRARAYPSADAARKSERVHLLKRNNLFVEKKEADA